MVFLVAAAGCSAPAADDRLGHDGLGVVDDVTYADDYTPPAAGEIEKSEDLEHLVKQTMARIELLRGEEFDTVVDVRVENRTEISTSTFQWPTDDQTAVMENQFWEALFVIGGDENAVEVMQDDLDQAIMGYYSSIDEEIVLVTDDEAEPISERTLVHELVHAWQHQHVGIGALATTNDEELGYLGVLEGEAEYLTELYYARCGIQWTCAAEPRDIDLEGSGEDIEESAGLDERGINPGVYLLLVQPYLSGPDFVAEVRTRAGWDRVTQLHDDPPESSQQVIHQDYEGDRPPEEVSITDRSSANWSTLGMAFNSESVGEAGIYTMLVTNNVVSVENPFSYRHEFSQGWAGDRLLPYEREDGATGFVWQTEWRSEIDASQFEYAYRTILEDRGAVTVEEGIYRLPDGSFEGAFKIDHDETTVTIVKGPSVDALAELYEAG